MSKVTKSPGLVENHEAIKAEWLGRLTALIDSVETWARELGWSTRRIEKPLEDLEIGDHKVPALLMQEEFHRGLLEPTCRSAWGVDGFLDLYLLPAWDDIAKVEFRDGGWQVLHVDPGMSLQSRLQEEKFVPLTHETFREVLASMKEHAIETARYIQRIKDVDVEHAIARLALDRLMAALVANPSTLPAGMKVNDVRLASTHLAGTYVIRLFAEFETALRSFWATARVTAPPGRTRDLLNGVAATCRIRPARLVNAHAVREYRNSLVHEREVVVHPIPITEARGHLCKFLGFLPPDW